MKKDLGGVCEEADKLRKEVAAQAAYQEDTRRLLTAVLEAAEQARAEARAQVARARAQAVAQVAAAHAQVATARAQAMAEARAAVQAQALEPGSGGAGYHQAPGTLTGIMEYAWRYLRGNPQPSSLV